ATTTPSVTRRPRTLSSGPRLARARGRRRTRFRYAGGVCSAAAGALAADARSARERACALGLYCPPRLPDLPYRNTSATRAGGRNRTIVRESYLSAAR